jgi:hypothetical protein
VGRLSIDDDNKKGLPELVKELPADIAKSKTRGALDAATEKLEDVFGGDGDEEPDKTPAKSGRR